MKKLSLTRREPREKSSQLPPQPLLLGVGFGLRDGIGIDAAPEPAREGDVADDSLPAALRRGPLHDPEHPRPQGRASIEVRPPIENLQIGRLEDLGRLLPIEAAAAHRPAEAREVKARQGVLGLGAARRRKVAIRFARLVVGGHRPSSDLSRR